MIMGERTGELTTWWGMRVGRGGYELRWGGVGRNKRLREKEEREKQERSKEAKEERREVGKEGRRGTQGGDWPHHHLSEDRPPLATND